jgi:hypothetical protein
MRLAQTTEWLLVAALIVSPLIPGAAAVRRMLGSPLGTAVGLVGIYLLAKKVSIPLALVVLGVLSRPSIHETFATDCACTDPTYTYDSGTKLCTKGTGADTKTASPVCCGLSQYWDPLQSKCASRTTAVPASIREPEPPAQKTPSR